MIMFAITQTKLLYYYYSLHLHNVQGPDFSQNLHVSLEGTKYIYKLYIILFNENSVKSKMSHCGNEENTTPTDPRIDFIAEYTLKSLRLKSDKWSRLIAPDEIKKFFNRFLEQDKPQVH